MDEGLIEKLRYCENATRCRDCPWAYDCAGEKVLISEAADAIEKLSAEVLSDRAILKRYGGETGIKNLQECANKYWDTLTKIPRWIPVTERLPPEWWPVLGLIQFHDEKEPPAQEVLWYLGNGHWRETWRGDMIESAVTHWMPLPEPPKEE